MSNRKKILIVGSKGFIGSHALEYFQNDSQTFEVWGCDVVVDYIQQNYFLLDISTSDFKFIFEKQTFDYCINCSGAASVPDSFHNPWRDFQLNTVNVYKILEAIRLLNPTCRFLNMSSAAVYGNPISLPIFESSLLQPVSPYGEHKRMAEEICQEYYSLFGIATCSLRIFSAYGEGLKKQLFWDLFKKVTHSNLDDVITIYGTGKESRDFIYIKDLLKCIRVILYEGSFKADVINVSSGTETTIQEAVSAFFALFPRSILYQFSGESRVGDPSNWLADVSLITSMGFKPDFLLHQGLSNYYKWARKLNLR